MVISADTEIVQKYIDMVYQSKFKHVIISCSSIWNVPLLLDWLNYIGLTATWDRICYQTVTSIKVVKL